MFWKWKSVSLIQLIQIIEHDNNKKVTAIFQKETETEAKIQKLGCETYILLTCRENHKFELLSHCVQKFFRVWPDIEYHFECEVF